MRKILISINSEHVAKILSGEKKFEYRTKVAQKDVDTFVIYETAPIKRVVGEVKILGVLALSPEGLWAKTKDDSGISKSFFDAYFQGRSVAYAYHLGEVKVYESPRELSIYGIKAAPQSFVYLNV